MQSSPPSDAGLDERLRLIVESYQRLTGKPLLQIPPPPCRGRVGEGVEVLHSHDSTPILTFPLQGGRNVEAKPNEQFDASLDIVVLRNVLWNAPRAIVAHGTEDDPVFFYGNRLALQLFEMDFEEFSRLPSRLSAEPLVQEKRVKLLEKVTQQGYVDGYTGMRIAKSGRRFVITDTTVWNLVDENGMHNGQAAVFIVQ